LADGKSMRGLDLLGCRHVGRKNVGRRESGENRVSRLAVWGGEC
jgi:hypothetical protein